MNIKNIAKLANLELTEKETVKFQEQIAKIIDYVDELQKIDTKKIKPTSQVTGKTNQFRDDVVTPSLPVDEALKNGKKTHNGFFVARISWS